MNTIIVTGNMTCDPEAYTTPSGQERSQFRIAVQRAYKNEDGTTTSDFFPVVAWRNTAKFCNKYLRKGRKIAVEGNLQTRQYEKDGQTRYITEIIASHVEPLSPAKREEQEAPKQEARQEQGGFTEVDDPDLPF